jgi:hypothetical protein
VFYAGFPRSLLLVMKAIIDPSTVPARTSLSPV